jgi:predicted DNA-binding protein YlxM (UPF0122 family)
MVELLKKANVGYIDPNTYELEGYSAIGPLLLFFNKVVVYGPVYGYISQSALDEKYGKTSLTPDDFRRFVVEGAIIPLAFDTFFDKAFRNRYSSPHLKIQSDFDVDLINGSSVMGGMAVIVDSEFKKTVSPVIAKRVIENNDVLRNNVNGIIHRSGEILPRYNQFKLGEVPIPESLQKEIDTDDRSKLLPYLFVYDFFNNKHVMQCQGEAEVHVEFGWLQDLYKGFHELGDSDRIMRLGEKNILLNRKEISALITEGLLICRDRLNKQEKRLDYKFINDFRQNCRNDFLDELEEIIKRVQTIEDRIKRKDEFCGRLEKKLKFMEAVLKINPIHIVDSVLTAFKLPKVSSLVEPIFGCIDFEKVSPFKKKWKYQFVKARKY